MKKVRCDALWNELTPEQLEKLDHWLFVEKLGYAEMLRKAQAEFGFKGSDGSLRRYYKRREQDRQVKEFVELHEDAEGIRGAGTSTDKLRQATMKMVAAQAFLQVREAPEEPSKWGPTVKLMVQQDRNETVREGQKIRQELRAEDQTIRRETTEFHRQKFEFDIVTRAIRALPELQKLAAAMKNPDPSRYGDKANWAEAREAIFGPEQGGIMLRNPEDKAQPGEKMENIEQPKSNVEQGGP